MNCRCGDYEPLKLDRRSIRKRIKETKLLKTQLEVIAKYKKVNTGHKLLRCLKCQQSWQSSYAWDGAGEYLFKVPTISLEEWVEEPYMQPDEMLRCGSINEEIMAQDFEETVNPCRAEGCSNRAIRWHILCKNHFLESRLKLPQGRLFPPYNIICHT